MSETVYQNLKNKLEQLYQRNFAVEVGYYDNNNNLQREKLIPLGGIKEQNLNQLRNVFAKGVALLSEIKKKPA